MQKRLSATIPVFYISYKSVLLQYFYKRFGEADIVERKGIAEQRGDFFIGKSGDAAADAGDIECCLVPFARKVDEIVDIGSLVSTKKS